MRLYRQRPSVYLSSNTAVGLGGGLDGLFLGMAIKDEAVSIGEHGQLGFQSGV